MNIRVFLVFFIVALSVQVFAQSKSSGYSASDIQLIDSLKRVAHSTQELDTTRIYSFIRIGEICSKYYLDSLFVYKSESG
jgi:hypothetical protein